VNARQDRTHDNVIARELTPKSRNTPKKQFENSLSHFGNRILKPARSPTCQSQAEIGSRAVTGRFEPSA